MTAHAMAGDRERCLAAGMDDYLSKPLDKETLLKALGRIPRSAGPPDLANANGSAVTAAPAGFSQETLLARLDGDAELMEQVIVLFQETTPPLLEEIRDSIARRAGPGLTRSAHALLSSLGAVGATEAHRLTSRMETLGLRADFAEAGELFVTLERETGKVSAVLAAFTPEHAAL